MINRGELEGRLDSFYYKKEFLDNTNKIEKVEYSKIGNLVTFSNKTWDKLSHKSNHFEYIEISKINVLTGEIKETTSLKVEEAPSRAKMSLKLDDIIISSTRPHRGAIAYISKEYINCIASTGFIVIGYSDNSVILRKYILEVLKQNIILKQLLQKSTGGNYPAITEDALKNTILPVPNLAIQQNIINIMDNAYQSKKEKEQESKKLLNGIDDYLLNKLGIKLPKEPENNIQNRTFRVGFEDIFNNRLNSSYHTEYEKKMRLCVYNGDYPVVKLIDICDLLNGYAFKSNDYIKNSNTLNIRMSNIRPNNIFDADYNVRYLPDCYSKTYKHYLLEDNDLIIAMTDMASAPKILGVPTLVAGKSLNKINVINISPKITQQIINMFP